jgi:hypothetical protein
LTLLAEYNADRVFKEQFDLPFLCKYPLDIDRDPFRLPGCPKTCTSWWLP